MKYLKRVLLITLIVVFSIVATWIIFKKYYLDDMVQDRIEQSIAAHIENDFHFSFDDININLISSNVKFRGINLLLFSQTDTIGHFKGDILIHLKGWRNIIFDNQKIITDLVLEKTDIYYAKDYPLTIKNKVGTNDQEVVITNINVTGNLHFAEFHNKQNGKLTTNFDFASALNFKSNNDFNLGNLIKQVKRFEVTQLQYYMPDGFYQVKITEIEFDRLNDLQMKQIVINPIDSKKTFAEKKKVATDFISVCIDSIQLMDFEKQLNEQIYIDKIQVFQPNFDVYKDKNFPENTEYKAILIDLFGDLKTPIHIKTMELNNMFIKYTELANQAKEAGELYFSDANATISNITNVKDSLQLSHNILITAEAKFYGVGMLKTTMRYKVLSKSGQFDIRGSLGAMSIKEVNKIISKLVPVKVNRGQLENLQFNFSGTRKHSEGEMRFKYSDLNIELLEVDFINSDFTKKAISRLGNMVMRNANPSGNRVFKIGEIKKDRNANKSMFNYWWVSLQSGFLSTLGVTAEKQKINYNSGEPATFVDKIGLGDK